LATGPAGRRGAWQYAHRSGWPLVAAPIGGLPPVAAEHWKSQPEAEDYPAATSFLSLLVGPLVAGTLVKALRKRKKLEHFAAKDILRASGLALLGADDPEVVADLRKVQRGEKLSPVLLVQGTPLWIADGYHRVCASYYLDAKAEVPTRIVARTTGDG
jgi:hypothetical protein